MLTFKRPTYTATCDNGCGKVETIDATTPQGAGLVLRGHGWQERVTKGCDWRETRWWCPTCNPANRPPSSGPGFTTGRF